MTEEYKTQLFRLATVLYADNNYEVATKTIHRKIIESVLLECKAKEFSVHQIIDFIQDNYSITFEEEALKEIVNSEKQDGFLTNYRKGNLYVCLSEKRKQTLLSKISNKTIDYFIEEFKKEYQQVIGNIDSKKLIHRFLYEIFSSNTSSFQKLINSKKDIKGLINLESTNYKEKEKEIINNFLHWDNSEKNKAIFNISSYALEYCMLTNKNGASSIHLESLKNKNFYLDTNIIYRTLGINGEDRKKRSKTFLKKFNESGEKLIISKSTDFEFREGIKGHIDRIRKFNTPRINAGIFQEVRVQQDIFNFYHKWRIGKANTSLDKFSAEVLSLYDNFKREFKIDVDVIIPYDTEEKSVKETLDDYTSKISSFKSKEGHEIVGSALIDSENILWVETKRGNKNQSIFDTKFFFISTDQGLRRWDYQRTDQTPTVLLPSQWMSILLRYINRTDDDFKSFVNFLNLKNNQVLITSERLHIVLAGISEMTSDIVQQRTLLNNLIENKFSGVIYFGTSNEQIFDNAKSYAESELEKLVEKLQKQNKELSTKQEQFSSDLEKHKKSVSSEIEQLKDDKSGIDKKLSDKENENKILKDKLIEKEFIEQYWKWQRTAYVWSLVAVVFVIYFVFLFVLSDWEYNFPHKLSLWKDSISDSFQKQIITGLMYSPLIGLWLISQNLIWKRLISTEKKTEQKRKIKKEVVDEYK
ncbi:MAG: hypothetical protein GXO89_16540 [Chlorobi bacterium]|nr:hypothetical protein [Chlorobiota bacterium]